MKISFLEQEQLDKIVSIIRSIVNTERIYLFGSYAYGTPQDDSDFDIYVIYDEDERPIKIMQRIGLALMYDSVKALDILASKLDNFEERCKVSSFERTIRDKGVILYDRGSAGSTVKLSMRRFSYYLVCRFLTSSY